MKIIKKIIEIIKKIIKNLMAKIGQFQIAAIYPRSIKKIEGHF